MKHCMFVKQKSGGTFCSFRHRNQWPSLANYCTLFFSIATGLKEHAADMNATHHCATPAGVLPAFSRNDNENCRR